jgi:hypothetical protein
MKSTPHYVHGMAIYTYVDKDFFFNSSEDYASASTHITAGIRALPIHSLHTEETLPRSAAGRIHERISREDPVQFMSIVAMVDLQLDR